jgi:hypothetical protein
MPFLCSIRQMDLGTAVLSAKWRADVSAAAKHMVRNESRSIGFTVDRLRDFLAFPSDTNPALDGEIGVPKEEEFSFDALLQRIHPAASRVQRLALETPSIYVVFDLLAAKDGHSLLTRPLNKRRKLLEAFAREYFHNSTIRLSPATTKVLLLPNGQG